MGSESGESTEKETQDVETSASASAAGAESDAVADEGNEPAAPPKAATAKPAAKAKPAGAKPAKPAGAKPAKPGAKVKRAPARRGGFPMRNVILFGALVVLLLAAFGVLGSRDTGGPNNAPRWKLNEPVDVEITLVASDANDLNCAMEGEIAGLHCGFTAANAAHPAAKGSRSDEKLLQPYSTTSRQNFLAAGLWMQPELKDAAKLDEKVRSMQNPRFSVACKFTPRGRAKGAKVQWKQGGDWNPAGDAWYVGDVKDCKLK